MIVCWSVLASVCVRVSLFLLSSVCLCVCVLLLRMFVCVVVCLSFRLLACWLILSFGFLFVTLVVSSSV